jgi:hypothetical protein
MVPDELPVTESWVFLGMHPRKQPTGHHREPGNPTHPSPLSPFTRREREQDRRLRRAYHHAATSSYAGAERPPGPPLLVKGEGAGGVVLCSAPPFTRTYRVPCLGYLLTAAAGVLGYKFNINES